ncbi:MAG: hypothetical protein GEV06_09480 [Luteitalea sp.]|nr:hypothetical protein [Luteitalea sp.]
MAQTGHMCAREAWVSLCAFAVVLAVLPLHSIAGSDEETVVTFDQAKSGTLPDLFRTMSSSDEEAGTWTVQHIDGRPVLSQTTIGDRGYRLAALKDMRIEHFRAGVRLRVGKGDEAAGLAWRVQDAENYYAVRLDINDHELIVYKFVGGNRVRLERLERLRLERDQWHEILVEHVGERLRVWLNDIPVASERDNSLHSPGALAFWLPGDSTAHFERLWYEQVDRD